MNRQRSNDDGFALIVTLLMLSTFLALMGAYFTTTTIELATTRLSSNATKGFFAAEAGLNMRAEQIRNTFIGYNRPTGDTPGGTTPCEGAEQGSGDFVCQVFSLGHHDAVTYVEEDVGNPIVKAIPQGELYQGLNAQEYRYKVLSTAKGVHGQDEALLELHFMSRLVPLFQFVAFYNKDLEILPGPTMNLGGPVHTNGDLYLNANNSLNIAGQITTAGDLYRGRKNNTTCKSKPVTALDPLSPLAILPTCPVRTMVPPADLTPWNGMVQSQVEVLTVPEPEVLNPEPGQIYWDKADLRIVLSLDAANEPDTSHVPSGVEIRNPDGEVNLAYTAALNNGGLCGGSIGGTFAIGNSISFKNNREVKMIRMLEIDLRALLDCIHNQNLMGTKTLADDTEGGLVFHFTVEGPDSADINHYGVRVRNGAEIQATPALGAPTVKGLTIVSDQAFYSHGDYNSVGKIPASFLCDAFNPLSNNWDLDDLDSLSGSVNDRLALDTTVNAAILAGTDVTGGSEGAAGQDGGEYNGGLENYPRMHEKWSGKSLIYRGSFVSLGTPQHSEGAWVYGSPQYTAPIRNWDYDTDFNDADKLPPLSPRFVYLRQELFVRQFEK